MVMTGPPYDDIDPGSELVLPLYIFVSVVLAILCAWTFLRWRQRRVKPPEYLFLTFLTLLLATVAMTVGLWDVVRTGFKMEVYQVCLYTSNGLVMLANTFIVLFTAVIFDIPGRVKARYLAACATIGAFVLFPLNYYGVDESFIPAGMSMFRVLSALTMALFSIVLYVRIIQNSVHASRRLRSVGEGEKFASWGFRLIGMAFLFLALFFVFLLSDTIAWTFGPWDGYTPFYFVAWGCAVVFSILAYLGVVMPKWVRELLACELADNRQ
ncbi:MAG: hypothetical protein ACTSU5_15740 [Promethearchaeota archaeon]